jgi:hypothetical protein
MPKVFYWSDALSFGLAAVVVTLLAVWAQMVGQAAPAGWVILWFTVLGFWGSYAGIIYWRWRFYRSIAYVTQQGVLVAFDPKMPPISYTALLDLREDTQREITRAAQLWSLAVPLDVIDRALRGALLVWQPLPFTASDYRPGLLAGLSWPARRTMWVGYQLPLASTTLCHELGHLFLYAWRGIDSDNVLAETWQKIQQAQSLTT